MRIETTVKYESDVPNDTNIDEYMAHIYRDGISRGEPIEITSVDTVRIIHGKKAPCPHCGAMIEIVDTEGYIQGELNSEGDIRETDREWSFFSCPECGSEIIEGAMGTAEVLEALWGKKKRSS